MSSKAYSETFGATWPPQTTAREGGPLSGFRIIDMSSVLMGPLATQALGDWGADIIKVEAPEGDMTRRIAPTRHAGMGAMYLNTNRSKRSIVIDLKHATGRELLLKLVKDADALVYNVRPQAMARLGLSWEEVREANPRIVYAGLFGYGQDGPYAAQPAYDDLIQAASGIAYLMGRSAGDARPRYVPQALTDRIVALAAIGAITASLLARERTGIGQRVDVPMFETVASFVMGDHMSGLVFEPPLDAGGYRRQLAKDRRPYQTSDGWLSVLFYTDRQWAGFFSAIGRPELPKEDPAFADFDSRMQNVEHVCAELAKIFVTRTTTEWLELLRSVDVPVMPVHDLQGLLDDPHLQAIGFFEPVEHPSEGPILSMRPAPRWSATPARPSRLAPRLAEHTREILREAGYDEAGIETLIASGAVRAEPA